MHYLAWHGMGNIKQLHWPSVPRNGRNLVDGKCEFQYTGKYIFMHGAFSNSAHYVKTADAETVNAENL